MTRSKYASLVDHYFVLVDGEYDPPLLTRVGVFVEQVGATLYLAETTDHDNREEVGLALIDVLDFANDAEIRIFATEEEALTAAVFLILAEEDADAAEEEDAL